MQTLWERLFNEDTGIGTALTTLFYHKPYQDTYRLLQQSQWWTKEQIATYQWRRLKALLQHAYDHVPYYTKLFDSLGLKPQEIDSIQAFQKIPFLTKELVRQHVEELKAVDYRQSQFERTLTGGSTGFPLHFFVEKGVWYARHLAYIRALLDRAECRPLDASVLITGSVKPMEYRPFSKTLILSSFSLSPENLSHYLKKMKQIHPRYLIGYPSALTLLASYMKDNAIVLDGINAVFCYGETVFERQREFLKEVFRCRIHDQYGHREQCVLAGTCEKSDTYHIFPEYGFVELVDAEGEPVMTEGGRGEIVATGFHTDIFPFIRYKTGDVGVCTSQPCTCGRQYPLLASIEGKVQDFVLSKTNRLIPLNGMHHLIARSTEKVKEYQLYQDNIGAITVRIVRAEGFSKEDEQRISDGFSKRFGDDIAVSLEYVESIPRTVRGKHLFLIQKLPIHFSP